MSDDAKLLDELKALRREIDTLRTQRNGARCAEPADGADADDPGFLATLGGLVIDAETTLREHPAATVAGAFAAGVLLGRLLAKG